MERILLATDGSEHAMRAARVAGELSGRFDAPVDVLHVVPSEASEVHGVPEYAHVHRFYVTERDMLRSAADPLVARAATAVEEAGGRVEKTEVMVGSPAHAIADFAEEIGADYIVMGRRGLGDLKGLLMGSVSNKVGQLAKANLITTK